MGARPNRLFEDREPPSEIFASNSPVTSIRRPTEHVELNQGVSNPSVTQNPEGTVNPNAYVNRVLAEFRQQLTGLNPGGVVVNRSIFSPAIKQYKIPWGVKLPKMANLYLGASSPSEHLDNYVVHMALNPNHDALKCKLFSITLGNHART